jgi:hypothetical protein
MKISAVRHYSEFISGDIFYSSDYLLITIDIKNLAENLHLIKQIISIKTYSHEKDIHHYSSTYTLLDFCPHPENSERAHNQEYTDTKKRDNRKPVTSIQDPESGYSIKDTDNEGKYPDQKASGSTDFPHSALQP